MTMAELELSAFFNAVTELFGSEQAQFSAEDCVHELIKIDGRPLQPANGDLSLRRFRCGSQGD